MCRSQCCVCISVVIIHVFIKLSERQDTLKSANQIPVVSTPVLEMKVELLEETDDRVGTVE